MKHESKSGFTYRLSAVSNGNQAVSVISQTATLFGLPLNGGDNIVLCERCQEVYGNKWNAHSK